IPVSLNVSNSALLNVSQAAINVVVLAGAAATVQNVSVTSTDGSAQAFNATAATSPVGLTWLGVTPNSGITPANILVTINPTNLAVGTYTGSVTIQGTGSASSAPPQTIPVTLIVASSTVTASPTSVTFSQSVGGSQPAAQTVQISGVPAGTTVGAIATTLSGTGWLTTSVSGNTVTINTNGSQLAQGQYTGVVSVIVPGAANSPLNIPVTFNVTATSALSVSPASVSFTFQLGSPVAAAAQQVQVTSTGSNVPVSATFTPTTGGNWLNITSSSSTTPATLTLSLNQSAIPTTPGTYSGTVTVSS